MWLSSNMKMKSEYASNVMNVKIINLEKLSEYTSKFSTCIQASLSYTVREISCNDCKDQVLIKKENNPIIKVNRKIYQWEQCDCWLTQRGQLNTHQKSVHAAIQFPFKIVRICLIIITHVWGGTFITSQEIMGIKYQCEQCDWNGNKLIILTNHHQNSAY